MSYWIHPEAEAELGDAAVYHATHASKAIGEAFLAEFEHVTDCLLRTKRPGLWETSAFTSATSSASRTRSSTTRANEVRGSTRWFISIASPDTGCREREFLHPVNLGDAD